MKGNKIKETQIDGPSLCKHQRNYLAEESVESYLKSGVNLRWYKNPCNLRIDLREYQSLVNKNQTEQHQTETLNEICNPSIFNHVETIKSVIHF